MFVTQLITKNMKKTVLVLLALMIISIGNTALSQDDKKFKFGMALEPSINWYSPAESKDFASVKSPMKFAFGLVTDFKLGGNVWLSTGIGLGGGGGVISYLENPSDSIGYLLYDDAIIETDGSYASVDSSAEFILLNQRAFRAQYVQIPFTLKMKTKEIGAMTYYGQFGIDLSINTKGRADDEGVNATNTANAPNITDVNIKSEMQPLIVGLNVGGGAEYNLSGSTSVFFQANVHWGFLNSVKNTSKQLIEYNLNDRRAEGAATPYTPQKFNSFGIGLKVGIQF
jgi:hypothetical protein